MRYVLFFFVINMKMQDVNELKVEFCTVLRLLVDNLQHYSFVVLDS
jgi:hypothetical protein